MKDHIFLTVFIFHQTRQLFTKWTSICVALLSQTCNALKLTLITKTTSPSKPLALLLSSNGLI